MSAVELAKQLRYWSLRMTTQAKSGHPTSCLSAADVMAVLLSEYLVYDPKHPELLANDRLLFSKGHAAPLLYAMYQAMGVIEKGDLLNFRQIDSPLEGHPTPRFRHNMVATGSLGMGLGMAAGMALALRRLKSSGRIWVLMGDGELAEGSVWEAAEFISQQHLTKVVALVDINRLGQSGPTAYGHQADIYRDRFASFGWRTIVIDGHDYRDITLSLEEATKEKNLPTAIIFRSLKGYGVSFLADKNGWHGKALSELEFEAAQAELEPFDLNQKVRPLFPEDLKSIIPTDERITINDLPLVDDDLSMREAIGKRLAYLAGRNGQIIALDGDVKNSTHLDEVESISSDQLIECYISEQLIIEVSIGLSKFGFLPVAATFGAFWTRAFDQLRMAALSQADLLLIGTHAGVAIGQDGPSQMGLEDIAMLQTLPESIVICPSDIISARRLLDKLLTAKGIRYLRVLRQKTPNIYSTNESFEIGKSKILKSSDHDLITVIACGTTVHQALKAHVRLKEEGTFIRIIDAYSVKPIDRETILQAAQQTKGLIVVEDHRPSGGLGDAVLNCFSDKKVVLPPFVKLAVGDLSRSGLPEELLDYHRISAKFIVEAVRELSEKIR